ncbi:FG-GAP repeat domain-containing protein [Rhizosphaericola mali]|uniref:VCBS repeat-containing protein n=1 Tax=Rhizosphaericola mali TaxID=2545455 RepID=A0A5P2G4U3_9BACT|nr:VCBS repeat-containing protein [Rhizosphaericola mali]QES88113.1 VCBS repeat-containing protein [Rhizosphaericola mali]
MKKGKRYRKALTIKFEMKNKLAFIVAIMVVVLQNSCTNKKENENSGKELTKMYCGACHLAPTPSLLTKSSWEKVLPVMSNFMGLRYSGDSIVALTGERKYEDTATLPQRISIAPEDFKKIAKYILENAPDSFKIDQHKNYEATNVFSVYSPKSAGMPFTTAIAYDSIGKSICIGSATSRALEVYNTQLEKQRSIDVQNMVTSCRIDQNDYQITNIGAFKPEPNSVSGNIMLLDRGKDSHPKIILDSLNRAVDSHIVDLDNDGKNDILVDEFGFLRGNYSWYKNKGDGHYTKKILRPTPGALKSYIEDVNEDGLKDIWTLFGQAKEGISLFINKGNGYFEEKVILQFPSVYGSTNFELIDVNGDGKKDIIYTCGDNNDYSSILKPYHGIYIYLNEGNLKFKLAKFIHMDGCYKAIVRDFNMDGKLDMAAISYFADYERHPEESFIYFEGKGNLEFDPMIIKDLPLGRWVCMDVKDLDGDGDPDILLGNLAADYLGRKDWQQMWMSAPAFIKIINTTK